MAGKSKKTQGRSKMFRAVLDLTPDSFEEPPEENIERPSPAEPTQQLQSLPEPPSSFSTPKENKEKSARREKVHSFLSRDENSRQLSGKKDTVTKN